jgi:molybdenum-dependent DNA-binding transcriptional regulator ModE
MKKTKLTGAEIGNALLQRYEALEKKYHHEVDKLARQVSVAQARRLIASDTYHLQSRLTVLARDEARCHDGKCRKGT